MRTISIWSLVVWVAIASVSERLTAGPLRIGVAEFDITPPPNYPMAGYYHERLSTGSRDPLKARAIVLLGEPDSAAIVICDLIGVSRDLSALVRRRVESELGIPASRITIAGTHSHTAPDYTRELYDYAIDQKPRTDGKPAYAEKLVSGISSALLRAKAAARETTVATGSLRQGTPVSFNRRFVMRDGTVRTWMSLRSEGVVRPAGPIDDELAAAVFRDASGDQPLGVLSNFALHLDTVGGTEWSADYPFFIEQAIRGALGDQVVSVFGTAPCGDINHVDPSTTERNKTDFIGQSLGQTLVQGLGKLTPVKANSVVVRTAVIRLPLQSVSEAEVRRSEKLLRLIKDGGKVEFLDQVLAYKTIMLDHLRNAPAYSNTTDYISWGLSRTWAGVGAELPVEVQVIVVGGELAIVCLPGEVFVDLGLAIKRASPFRTTMIVELSNCKETIYIPTRAAFAGGSYEVTNAATEPGSGELLVETALRLLREAASP